MTKDKQTIDIRKGESEQITLTATYSDNSSESVSDIAEWSSDDDQVATVVNGKVTGQSAGTALITGKVGKQSVTVEVNVEVVKRIDTDKSK